MMGIDAGRWIQGDYGRAQDGFILWDVMCSRLCQIEHWWCERDDGYAEAAEGGETGAGVDVDDHRLLSGRGCPQCR